MTVSVSEQLLQAAAALLLGGAAGLFYDCLRVLRKRIRRLAVTVIMDILFWLLAGLGLFALGMGVGKGQVRLFMALCAAGGAVLYFAALSSEARWALDRFADLIARIFRVASAPVRLFFKGLKKIAKKIRKYFKKIVGWGKIRIFHTKESGQTITEGYADENQKGKYIYEAGRVGAHALRGREPGGLAGEASARGRRKTGAGRRGAGAGAGKRRAVVRNRTQR